MRSCQQRHLVGILRKSAFAFAIATGGLLAGIKPADAELIDGSTIEALLKGNAVINDEFGCVHYENASDAVLYGIDGSLYRYSWGVDGDRYISVNGNCGMDGCQVERLGASSLRFFKKDGSYDLTVRLVEGPACNASRLTT